jgi:hypothetical protein
MVKADGDNLAVNKYLLIFILTLLSGGGVFTGYSVKKESEITKEDIEIIRTDIVTVLRKEFGPMNQKLNQIDSRTQVIVSVQSEVGRRLKVLEESRHE